MEEDDVINERQECCEFCGKHSAMTREEAIDEIKWILETTPKEPPIECDYFDEWFYNHNKMIKALEMAIEALEQEPCKITAKWVENPSTNYSAWLCSKCGVGVGLRRSEKPRFIKFCPNCGAKMVESEE